MSEDGYRRYQRFFQADPLLCTEWRDSESEAVGWLVMNSLEGGAAGGGTRMKKGGSRQEAVFLAKTMEVKFQVCGPVIGGAKSVIDFDPADPRKPEVLRRYYRAIAPFVHSCYGTAGDLNVDEIKDVVPITRELGLAHPQEGIVRGHWRGKTEAAYQAIFSNLHLGVGMPVPVEDVPSVSFRVPDLITGFGLTAAVKTYFESLGRSLRGQRILIEGFGAVGGSAAYYLSRAGAKVVGVVTKPAQDLFRWRVDAGGLDVQSLLAARRGSNLPDGSPEGPEPKPFWETAADVFVPASASETLDEAVLARLRAAGVSVIACGSNVPFKEAGPGRLEVQKQADAAFSIIPDFIANCGMARCFAFLMEKETPDLTCEAIFADTEQTIRSGMEEILSGYSGGPGLLQRAFTRFVPGSPNGGALSLPAGGSSDIVCGPSVAR